MRWRTVLEGVSWIVAVPAVLLAVSHADVGELGVGAFGPPASETLGRWLLAQPRARRSCSVRDACSAHISTPRGDSPVVWWRPIPASCGHDT